MPLTLNNPATAGKPPSEAPQALRSMVVGGSLLLLAGSGLVGAANLFYNIAVARLLGPVGFGHAAAVYTLLMLMSAVTLAFQIVCAKLVANHDDPAEKAATYAGLHRRAWRYGLGIGVLLILARGLFTQYLNLPSSTLIVLLGIGTAFYIPLGARRGGMQGTYAFHFLAINLILEGLARLGGAYFLIKLGMGVTGAVLASVAAVILAYLFGWPPAILRRETSTRVDASFREGLQAIVFFVGQVIINNFDIVLVKHFFRPEAAGLYAAVSLVGRVVNMCAWSVVNTMFPISAGARSEDDAARPVLTTSLLLVFGIVASTVLGLWFVPSFIWKLVFGAQFQLAGYGAISTLLVLYAVTSGVYSLSSVIIAYEMSRRIANTAWLQLAFSGALIMGIVMFHGSLLQVILVQLELMLVLLAIVLVPVLRAPRRRQRMAEIEFAAPTSGGAQALSENAVIAEFLKNEFHHRDFDEYRAKFQAIVTSPNLCDDDENALRRALLFIRRGPMWRELPSDTRWFEVRLGSEDLSRLRVFPRAHWRRIAQGSFYLKDVVERVRLEAGNHTGDAFFAKLRRLMPSIRENTVNRTVLLIGVDGKGPLTILDGNHRVTAAMLVSPSVALNQFRFLCGLSPRMTECCWYQTNVTTLWRYGKNLIKYLAYDPQSVIGRLLKTETDSSS
jgi:O-antigen/teichoic acid export membrane protein